MKRTPTIIVLLLAALSTAEAQVPAGADSTALAQAQAMLDAYREGNYEKMTTWLYPTIVRSIGGVAGMERLFAGAIDRELRQRGVERKGSLEIVDVQIDSLISIVATKKEVQCTLPLRTVISGGYPYFCGRSTIAGYSTDKGVSWKFVIESVGTLESIRSMHEEFSATLRVVPVEVSVCDVAKGGETRDER